MYCGSTSILYRHTNAEMTNPQSSRRLSHWRTRIRQLFCRPLVALLTLSALGGSWQPLAAQERPAGVSLSLVYSSGQRVAIMVLAVSGAGGDSIKTMLERDLDFSNRFQHVPAVASPAPGQPFTNYALAATAGAAGVVHAQLLPSGWLRVVLHDVGEKKIRDQNDFPLPTAINTDAWRMGVHRISDQIEAWVTGVQGIAATRITFTREDRIWVVDSDGANPRPVTPRGLSPAWHPSGRHIVYHVMEDDRHRLVVTDVVTGAQRSLTSERGAQDNFASVAPDGRRVVFARSVEESAGQMDLFVMPFDGGRPTRITVARGSINLAPSWSPDGRRLTFASDRSGRNQIYIADADGTNVSVITADAYGERNQRADPSWSPDGRLIAFSSQVGGTQQILTFNLRDRTVSQVTSDGQNKTPSWAPDGRHLVFTSTRGGTEQLWIVDVESGRMRQLTRGSAARLSDWSPRMTTTQ